MHGVIGARSKEEEEGQTPARKVPLVRLIQARALSRASVLEPQRRHIGSWRRREMDMNGDTRGRQSE